MWWAMRGVNVRAKRGCKERQNCITGRAGPHTPWRATKSNLSNQEAHNKGNHRADCSTTIEMRQVQARVEDDKLDQERRRTYLGTARIRFEALHFGRRRLREPDEKHVEYLEGCFSNSGCRPLEKQNHISAKVSLELLREAILASGIRQDDLLSNHTLGYVELEMPSGRQIECLHGQHRILAASRVLGPHDKWWAVDLYRTGIFPTTHKDSNFS
jgi:hypothetical protein